MEIFILAISLIGFTLLVAFAYERGNIFYFIARPLIERIEAAQKPVDAAAEKIKEIEQEIEWIETALPAPEQVKPQLQGQQPWMLITTVRPPTKIEKAAYRKEHKKAPPVDLEYVEYRPAAFDIEAAERVQRALGERQKLTVIVEDHQSVALLQAQRRAEIEKVRAGDLKKALAGVERLEYISKPLIECPVCMLFWYGSGFFAGLAALGLADWSQWPVAMATAYGLILGVPFVKQF